MVTLAESVTRAMDGTDPAIVPFLPFILQDTWEIGTPAETVIDLVRRLAGGQARLDVLDLGCGKGAVAVRLAAELGCRCLGIDAIPEFIEFAEKKAAEWGVAGLCRFETGDIRLRIGGLGQYDVVVLGAIGPVFGDIKATLTTLAPHLQPGGIVVIDDGYIPDHSPYFNLLVARRSVFLRQVEAAGMRLAEEVIVGAEEIRRLNQRIFRGLERRCRELMALHPEREKLFADYIRRQVEENDALENEVVCAVMVIKKGEKVVPGER